MTTRHLKLTNTTEIPHYFQLLVSKPFSVSQEGASRSHRALGRKQEGEQETAARGKQLVLHPQENTLVSGGVCGPRQGAHTPGPGPPSSHVPAHVCTESPATRHPPRAALRHRQRWYPGPATP